MLMKCCICNEEVKENQWVRKIDESLCDSCHMEIFGCFGRCGHGLTGVTDGPGSGNRTSGRQCCFELQNTYWEVHRAVKAKEESGFFIGHPEREAQAKKWLAKYEHLKDKRGIDYQKVRHPLDD